MEKWQQLLCLPTQMSGAALEKAPDASFSYDMQWPRKGQGSEEKGASVKKRVSIFAFKKLHLGILESILLSQCLSW